MNVRLMSKLVTIAQAEHSVEGAKYGKKIRMYDD
jgi:hypothetical protein